MLAGDNNPDRQFLWNDHTDRILADLVDTKASKGPCDQTFSITKFWKSVSSGLRAFGFKVSADSSRHRWNALIEKHRSHRRLVSEKTDDKENLTLGDFILQADDNLEALRGSGPVRRKRDIGMIIEMLEAPDTKSCSPMDSSFHDDSRVGDSIEDAISISSSCELQTSDYSEKNDHWEKKPELVWNDDNDKILAEAISHQASQWFKSHEDFRGFWITVSAEIKNRGVGADHPAFIRMQKEVKQHWDQLRERHENALNLGLRNRNPGLTDAVLRAITVLDDVRSKTTGALAPKRSRTHDANDKREDNYRPADKVVKGPDRSGKADSAALQYCVDSLDSLRREQEKQDDRHRKNLEEMEDRFMKELRAQEVRYVELLGKLLDAIRERDKTP